VTGFHTVPPPGQPPSREKGFRQPKLKIRRF
jgi:hypothetical protein